MLFDTPDLKRAIARATDYLKARIASGDYGLSCISTETDSPWPHNKGHLFAGFFISEALRDALSNSERSILSKRIYAESRDGLWSYAPGAHPGAISSDDTAFVLRCCRNLGIQESPERLVQFYKEPQTGCGGFTTFLNLIGPQPHLAFEQSLENHRQFHPEVNANVFLILKGTELSGYINYDLILNSQSPDGHWFSYCYPSRYYATYLFLDLIRDLPMLMDARERGVTFLHDSQCENGSWGTPGEPYETALAINALAVCGRFSRVFDKGIAFLLRTQRDDGSWATPKVIWEWLERDGDNWQAFDSKRVVATSLCLIAIKEVSNRQID